MKKLVLASGNPGKVREIRALLDPLGIQLLGASPGHVTHRGLRVERVIYQPEHSLRAHLITRR